MLDRISIKRKRVRRSIARNVGSSLGDRDPKQRQ